jgi:hypothetical protein
MREMVFRPLAPDRQEAKQVTARNCSCTRTSRLPTAIRRPLKTDRCLIRSWERSAMGWPGGVGSGWSWSARCGDHPVALSRARQLAGPDHFRVRHRDRARGVIHECHQVA